MRKVRFRLSLQAYYLINPWIVYSSEWVKVQKFWYEHWITQINGVIQYIYLILTVMLHSLMPYCLAWDLSGRFHLLCCKFFSKLLPWNHQLFKNQNTPGDYFKTHTKYENYRSLIYISLKNVVILEVDNYRQILCLVLDYMLTHSPDVEHLL